MEFMVLRANTLEVYIYIISFLYFSYALKAKNGVENMKLLESLKKSEKKYENSMNTS